MTTSDLSFHDATVVVFDRRQDAVCLGLSDVHHHQGSRSVRIEVRDIVEIIADGAVVDTIAMEHEDGEVLTLEVSDESIFLIVQWNDFDNRKSVTRSYRITGRVTVDLFPREVSSTSV